MPRKPFIIDPEKPYHLVARSNNQDWYSLPLDKMWSIYSDYLSFIHFAYGVRIHAFVLMNNHFHLISSFPEGNLSASMNYFMRETSRAIGIESGRINHVYGSRIFRSCLVREHYFLHAYKYVYRNPVEAGKCKNVEEYEYSTLHGLLGFNRISIPVEEDTLLFDSISTRLNSHLNWLNKTTTEENRAAIKRALRQSVFKLPNQVSSRKKHPLEDSRY